MDNLEIAYNADKSRSEANVTSSECYGGCGTSGFLACTIDHKRDCYVKSAKAEEILLSSVRGVEKKALPHMLCTTNMILR